MDASKAKAIGEELRRLRREAGRTQEEVAGHIGVSAMMISYWERGLRNISGLDVQGIASYLGYSDRVDDILGKV